ncbi:MAG: GH3 auxin-responsive promoter family protein [Cyclobacteriaceae bacterium]
MGIRSFLARPFSSLVAQQTSVWSLEPERFQKEILFNSLKRAADTRFGKEHGFSEIQTAEDFRRQVPIKDYEQLKPWFDLVAGGGKDILWPGKPAYLAKTSGTTSGTKYIPITNESLPNHINGARNALLSYVHETGKSAFLDGSLIFLSGSPELDTVSGIPTGRLSGIVNHHVPAYLRSNQKPSYQTNIIEDWEEKLERIIDETIDARMTLISGIPPWVQMYFDRIQARTGKNIKDVFPDFSVFVYGGVNFSPYRAKLEESIGKKIDSIELYPASEGFIAYQDSRDSEGMLLLSNSGIYYEFVPAEEYFSDNPRRLGIEEVEIGKNYAVIINNNAGLWGYSIGDTVKFISKYPHRLLVTGRIKHFISAFGEHVIGEEVEKAMRIVCTQFPETAIAEFTVAPQVNPADGLPHHEWLISFTAMPGNPEAFGSALDKAMRELNVYYDDLISGNILRPLVITKLQPDAFIQYMKSVGKLGGQNKVPRLSNDRKIAEVLHRFTI